MKKISLVPCFMVVSLCTQAELQPISEYEMDSVSGQAGIDLELDVNVSIGEVRYTDTEVITQETIFVDDGNGNLVPQVIDVSDGDGGSLSLSIVSLGGIDDRSTLFGSSIPNGGGSNLDNIIFKVDIESDGSLKVIGKSDPEGDPVDFKFTVDEVYTSKANGDRYMTLVDDLSIYGGILGLNMSVDSVTNDVTFDVQAGLDEVDLDLTSFLSMNIKNAYLAGSNHNGNPQSLDDNIAKIYVVMSEEDGGLTFDFAQAIEADQNIFDMGVEELTIGDGVIGSLAIDDLNIRGLAVNVSGH